MNKMKRKTVVLISIVLLLGMMNVGSMFNMSGKAADGGETESNAIPHADASFGEPYIGQIGVDGGVLIEFDASNSYDSDEGDYIDGYRWDFDYNGYAVDWDTGDDADGNWISDPIVNYIYYSSGNYVVKLQVKDSKGAISFVDTTYVEIEDEHTGGNGGGGGGGAGGGDSEYDLVIIAPSEFSGELQRLVDHKNNYCGMNTLFKTTGEIYSEYSGVDKPEQIKYFIKDALETWDIKYVLLVGGMKSLIWGCSRDDENQGTKDWHVPVRYTNLFDEPKYPLTIMYDPGCSLDEEIVHDPGVISDLYYMDIYKEGNVFEDWDPNNDGIFAAWGRPGVENDTNLDLCPDVCVGRLACRNTYEVKTMVDKIIYYEQGPADPSWFNKMIVISGDGFLDQEDLDIQWDVNGLPDGDYTIYARSTNDDGKSGPIDVINVKLDRSVASSISFNHDDHLQIDNFPNYPHDPIAEITSPSNGDILGYNNSFYEPGEEKAFCNEFTGWANVSYTDGIMHIRGKSYDPRPYGVETDIHVWIENSNGETVFSDERLGTKMYFEGEWTTGEQLLKGRGGALYYMPDEFEKIKLWTSNGKLTGQSDVREALGQGCGFVFFSGHGNPRTWGDHYPGVPGNRRHASMTGLVTFDYAGGPPFFPMDTLSNDYKLPVVVIGGCHNSQFNVTLFRTLQDRDNSHYMWTFGRPTFECWSWWITRVPQRGAIATIGNTGLGYGRIGDECTNGGGDAWITIEFFRQYGEEGHEILGDAHMQAIVNYVNTFDMSNLEEGHAKTVQQWVLLGDPSLKIGGYDYSASSGLKASAEASDAVAVPGKKIEFRGAASGGTGECTWHWNFGDGETSTEKYPTHTYDEVGYHTAALTVTDSNNEVDTYSTLISIEPQVPTPNRPSGQVNINIGETHTYTTSVSTTDWDIIYYKFSWGDETESDWLDIPSASHSWNKEGQYNIKAKALFIKESPEIVKVSEWSDPLPISISKNKQLSKPQIKLQTGIYIENIKKTSFPVTIIVGSIDIKIDAEANRVEFYIDDELKSTDYSEPYVWTWDETLFGVHTLTVRAYDNDGNSDTDEMKVWKFF